VQLHHRYDKNLSAFTVRHLKGTELEKWARCQPNLNSNISEELRELQLLVSHGKFHHRDFIVAERCQRFIGKLRLRQIDETLLKLDPPVVLEDFDFYRVARALMEHSMKTLRTDHRPWSLIASPDGAMHERLHQVYEHLGFTLLPKMKDEIPGPVYVFTP
jgi:hypothetical protein